MFSGGCVIIDNASGYVRIKHQVAINATEKFKAKINFDREAQSQVVVIKGYHTDNGVFNVSEFMEELLKSKELNKDHLLSGKMVSADHYISRA